MTIIIRDAYTTNILWNVIDESRSINYKNIMIINYTYRLIRMTPQLGASLTDDFRSIIYNHTMFIIQPT